jgi:hypothetical protein
MASIGGRLAIASERRRAPSSSNAKRIRRAIRSDIASGLRDAVAAGDAHGLAGRGAPAATFDQVKLAPVALSVWRRGGLDTLVKVAPFGTAPVPDHAIGYCTTFKFIAGRTPEEMARVVGVSPVRFISGAEIFTVCPLPEATEFELVGYAPGDAADPPGYVSHPIYLQARGAPRWDLARVSQRRLVWIARVPRGQGFVYPAHMLGRLTS